METLPESNNCFPKCPKFRCGKNAVQFRGRMVWCKWTDEECDPATCSYAMCITRRLLSNGICGQTVKRRTKEKGPEEDDLQSIRVKGKIYRKIGEREIF